MKKNGKKRGEMIKPTKPIETYKQYGFKKCKGEYGKIVVITYALVEVVK